MFGRNMRVKKDGKVLNLRKRLPLIEFHKEPIKDYWRYLLLRKEALGKALGFLFLIFILGSFFYTEANVATFYTDTCLGGWQNSNNASGKPEVADGGADFSDGNSAVLSNSIADIFCSGFKGDTPKEGTAVPKKFVLKFSWLVTDSPIVVESNLPSVEGILENVTPVPTTEETPRMEPAGSEEGKLEIIEVKNDSDIPELQSDPVTEPESNTTTPESTPAPEPVPEATPAPVPEPTPEPAPQSFLDRIITKVFAQEIVEVAAPVVEPPAPEVSAEPTPTPEPTSETISTPEPTQESEPEAKPTPAENTTSIEEVVVESLPVEADLAKEELTTNEFLEVAYTIDGLEWKSLGKVSETSWQNTSFEITDPDIKTWEDLSKIQISIKNLPTIDTPPVVYLDSVYLEVEYDNVEPEKELPIIEITDEGLGAITSDITDFGSDDAPVFDIEDPNLSLHEIETLLKSGQAEIVSDPEGTLINNLSFPSSSYNIDLSNNEGSNKGLVENIFDVVLPEGGGGTSEQLNAPTDATGVIVLPLFEKGNQTEEDKKSTNPFDVLKDVTSFLDTKVALAGIFNADIVKAEVFDSLQQPTDIETAINTVKVNGVSKQTVSVEKPGREFRPGKYTLNVTLLTDYAKIIYKQDFTWGVLAINTDKSIYQPGEKAYLQMGVLNDKGDTICNASMQLEIKSPNGETKNFDTQNDTITADPSCGPNNVIYVPDYYAHYENINEPGLYQMKLTATTENGTKSMTDTFEVTANPFFDVRRVGPTRINPLAKYPVTMYINSKIDWSGVVEERVPVSFDITQPNKSIPYDNIVIDGEDKVISWNLNIKGGQEAIIGYYFDAPNRSPDFHLLGPLEFNQSSTLQFTEARKWQIANDVVVVDILTAGTSWTVPFDFDIGANTIEGIGGGGGAGGGGTGTARGGSGGGGGGGGEYRKIANFNNGASPTVTYAIGAGGAGGAADTDGGDGTDTTWNTNSLIAQNGSKGIKGVSSAPGGLGGAGGTGGTGAAGNNNGGAGAQGGASANCCGGGGGGGGGAGGTTAVGGAGTAGTAGGVGGGPGGAGGAGGANSGGSAGGASSGNGGNGTVWTDTIDSSTGGSGGGGGGGDGATTGAGTAGGLAGNYGAGGGGGGGGDNASAGGAGKDGKQGVIAVTYTSTGMTVSGTTDAANGTTVKIAVNSTVQAQSTTVSAGSWTITGVTIPAVNDIITVWLDGVADGSESTAITKYSFGNVSGMDLTSQRLMIGSNQNTSLTITNLGQYDADNDEDVMHTSNSSVLLVQGASNSYTNEFLYIDTGDTLTVSTGESVTSEAIRVQGTLTSSGTATYTITGTSGNLFYNLGTWTQSTSTVNVTSASGSPNLLTNDTTFHKLTINSTATVINAGAAITMSSADASNKLYVQAGVLNDVGRTIVGTANGTLEVAAGAALCISGAVGSTNATCDSTATPTTASTFPTNYTNGNITLATTSTVYYNGDVAMTISSTPTYGNLYLKPQLTSGRTYTAGGALTINGNFDVNPTAGSALALTVNLAGTVTVASGKTTTITRTTSATSLVDLRPVSTDYNLSTGLLNIATGGTLDATSAASTITLTGTSGTLFTRTGTFTITSGTPTVVMNPDAAVTLTSGTITFYNLSLTPTITSSRTYTFGSSALTVNGDFMINPTSVGSNLLRVNMGNTITVAASKTTTIKATNAAVSTLDTVSGSNYALSTGKIDIQASGTLEARASTITLTGTSSTLFTNNGTFSSGTSSVEAAVSGGSLTILAGSFTGSNAFYNFSYLNTGGGIPTVTIGVAVTCNNNFTVGEFGGNGNSTFNLSGALIVTGTLKVQGSTLDFSTFNTTGTNYAVTAGKLDLNTHTTFTANASTITLTGTSGTLITKAGTGAFTEGTSEVIVTSASGAPTLLSSAETFHKLTINSAATVINAGAVITMSNADASNKLYVQVGALNDGGNTIVGTANGTLEVAAGATLCISGAAAGSASMCDDGYGATTASTFPTNYTNGNIILAATSTVWYYANGAQTISTTPTYGNLWLYPSINAARTYTIASGSLAVNGNFRIASWASSSYLLTVNMGGNITVAATKTTSITGYTSGTALLDLRPASTDYNLSTGLMTIAAGGTLDATGTTSVITVADDWTNAGTFTAGTSRVVLSTTTTATIGGGPTTFYDLTSSAAGKEIDFSTTGTHIVHVTHNFTMTGTYGNNIKLYSTSSGTKWHFHPTGTPTVDFVETRDGGCESGSTTVTTSHFLSLGNNDSCWSATTMTFSLSANAVNLGTLTTGAAGTGTHTITAVTGAPGGVSITYKGATLTNQSSATIPVYTSSASSPGTAGFGINLKDNATPNVGANPTTNYGTCNISAGYSTADAYTFVANTTTTIANTNSLPGDCVYTVSYIANVASLTASGTYSTAVTYIMTGTF